MPYLPFDLGYLTPEIAEKAKKELGETEEVKKQAIAELRRLVKSEPKLVCALDDNYLLQFLRPRKFNVKRAFSLLLNFYHVKKYRPEVYTNDFAGFRNSAAIQLGCVLPYRDKDGAPVVLCKLEKWDYNERKFYSIVHDLTIVILFFVEDPATQVCGMKFIFDVKSLSLNHLRHIHPKYLRLIAMGIKNCLPVRLRAVHILNESFLFQYIWNILKYIVGEKIRSRLHFHSSSLESLHKHISPDILPIEYGGKLKYDPNPILKLIDSLKHVYDEKMSYGYRS